MEKKEKEKKKKYPVGAENYTLYEEVGSGVSASVHRALCIPLDEIVAIKIMDFERDNCDLNNVSREAQTMVLVDHPNVLKSHCSFVNDHSLWVVMPFMSGGSCLHILKSAYPDGFDEVIIATILREVLKGLDYLHSHGHIHRDVKAGNILIDANGGVKLGDFGVSACLFDSGDRQKRDTFTGTPCWMAPEIMEQVNGYDYRCDIWSFGITCLEFAHGHAPFSKYPPMKVLLMTLQNAPPGLDYERDKKFSKLFKQMTGSCLVKDPSQRPSAKKLLKHSFFKQARSNDYIVKRLLEGLPALGDRLMELKKKEEDMLAQKKIPYGQKEEMSQNEYKRGISAWDFNIEDLKAQASLIQDDDIVAEKDQKGSTSSLQELDTQGGKIHQHQFSCTRLCSDATESGDNNQPALPISADPTCTSTMVKDEKFDDDVSIASSAPESCDSSNSSIQNLNNLETNLAGKFESDDNGKSPESDKFQIQSQSASSYNSDAVPQKVGGMPSESSSRAPRASVGNGVVDEKAKGPVVEQRGRFKVTSENVEFEKVGSPLQKSQSMQVISQHPAVVSSPIMPSDATQPNITNSSLYPMILSLLETNIRQREHILNIMKQFAIGDSTVNRAVDNGGCTQPTNTTLPEKSSLESAHDREKDLICQLTDLQWKLILAQEELQKQKTDRPQPDF